MNNKLQFDTDTSPLLFEAAYALNSSAAHLYKALEKYNPKVMPTVTAMWRKALWDPARYATTYNDKTPA